MDLNVVMEGIYNIQKRLDSMENRLDSMETRLDSMENRLDSMENRLENVEKKIDFLHDDVVRVKENQEFQEQQIDTFIQKTAKNSSDIRTLKRVLNNN